LWSQEDFKRRTVPVPHQLFAVRVEEHRVVAAEVDPTAAASLLDAAQPLLLGTAEDLGKVARRFERPLVTIARAEPRRSSGAARQTPAASRPPVPEPVAEFSQPEARGLFGMRWRAGRSHDRTAARVA
jgi:hypothetical protein